MRTEPKTEILWSPGLLAQFKQAYQTAKDDGSEVFIFQGSEFVVEYAKYLIEYLDGMFGRPARQPY